MKHPQLHIYPIILLAVLLSVGCSGGGDEDFLIEEIPVVSTPEVQTPDDGEIRFKVGTFCRCLLRKEHKT